MDMDDLRPRLSVGAIPLPLCLCDRYGSIVQANAAFAALAGLDAPPGAGRSLVELEVVAPAALRSALRSLSGGGDPFGDPIPGAGALAGREVLLSVAQDGHGQPAGLVLLVLPSAAERAEQDQRARFALECAGQWVWEWDLVTDRVWRSPNWQRTLGYADGEAVEDAAPWNIVHPDDRPAAAAAVARIVTGEAQQFEANYRLKHRDGSWRWFMSRGRVAARGPDGRATRVLAASIDVNHQKKKEARLRQATAESAEVSRRLAELNAALAELSELDGLTGLANRRAFERIWPRAVANATEEGTALSLLMVDVDFFKRFNDRMGHLAGDHCLRRIAGAMTDAAGPQAMVSRYGGEEFAVLVRGADAQAAQAVAESILAAVSALGEVHPGSPFGRLTVSVGIAALAPGETGDQVLKRADDALYAAKRNGRNQVQARP